MKPYFQRGGITIYHGDAFDVLHELEGVGAVVTDPPYSSGGQFRGDRAQSTVTKYVRSDCATVRPEFSGDNRDQRSFLVWASMWLNAARRASVPGAPVAIFSDWRQLPTMTDAIQAAGYTWRNLATWWKPGARMQAGRFSASAEYVVYGSNGPLDEIGQASPQNVFKCGIEREKQHIAQKPESVLEWVLGIVPKGASVLDPFMGSGSTLSAARKMGSEAVGIDCDERSCELAANRLDQGVFIFSD